MIDVTVIIASLGRPENLAALLNRLAAQTHLPARVILSLESAADAPPEEPYPFPVDRIFGPRGSSVQRNRGLDRLPPDTDIVVFYDDDFIPSCFALAGMARFFVDHPDVAGAKGLVLQDGINGPGIPPDEARAIMDAADAAGPPAPGRILSTNHGLYGCNMAYRVDAIHDIRFDENLPLYGWLEDLDFGGRVDGTLVHCDAFHGVHCGEKRGREKNGKRLGYSQIANPIYLVRKGSIPRKIAYNRTVRNFLANHRGIFRPEPWIDRRGRVIGNWIAIWDFFTKKMRPDRIHDL